MSRRSLAFALLVLSLTSSCALGVGLPCPPQASAAGGGISLGGSAQVPAAFLKDGTTIGGPDAPVPNADVSLGDAAGLPLPGVHATTGTDGSFTLPHVVAGFAYTVQVRFQAGAGQYVTFEALVMPSATGTVSITIDLASTLLTLALLAGRSGLVGAFDPATYQRALARIRVHVAAGGAPDPRDGAAVSARIALWSADDAELQAAFTDLQTSLTTPSGSIHDMLERIAEANGQAGPAGTPSASGAAGGPPASALPASPLASPGRTPGPITASGATAAPPSSAPSAAPAAPSPNQGIVTTLAGSGQMGTADGPGASAAFNRPGPIAVDAGGNVYTFDGSFRLRKIAPDGTVSTLAGSGVAGVKDGQGTAAQLSAAGGIAVDPAGNLFFTEKFVVRKVTPAGVVTTVAGAGSQGHLDGPAAAARFNNLSGIAVDPHDGTLYVAEYSGCDLRKIAPDGTVSTLAGQYGQLGYADGPGTAAQFRLPFGLALGPDGSLYVTELGNNDVRKVLPDGTTSTLAGNDSTPGFADGQGTAALFKFPIGLAFDPSGALIVGDTNNQRIRRVGLDGSVTTLAGSSQRGFLDGTGAGAKFNFPNGVAVDARGTVYVADTDNQRIRVIR